MNASRQIGAAAIVTIPALLAGCASPKADFSRIERPQRAAELDAYDVFAGTWTWEAEMLNADTPDKAWNGTAEWQWTLDRRCLHGRMSTRSERASFDSEGIWSWHPKTRKYVWWMFNNWGYPQEGTADYDAATRTWSMKYKSVGLDGTDSFGQYRITVADNDTLDWRMVEWADPFHLVKKLEMKGTYRRRK